MSEQRYLVLGSEVRGKDGKPRYVSAKQLVNRHKLPMKQCHLVDSTEDLWAFNRKHFFDKAEWKVISPFPAPPSGPNKDNNG